MSPLSNKWRVAAVLYTVINVGGAGFAVAMGEPMHAAGHVALLFAGYIGWKLATRVSAEPNQLQTQQADPGLEYLQQSVDAIALEVERIAETQRYNEKLRAELGETPPLKKDK
jgi:hypothetical protein